MTQTAWEVRDAGNGEAKYGVAYRVQYVIPDFLCDTPEQAMTLLAYFRPHLAEPNDWQVVRVVIDTEAKP